MNPRTIDALEEAKERLFNQAQKIVNTKYEDMKDTVKEDILDGTHFYLKWIVDRLTQDDYSDPNFENSVDYQLVNALESRFNDWFEENYNEQKVAEMNRRAR